jgi:hypothetical protein
MFLAEPISVTQRIAQEFERCGIRYSVGGSLASSLHGIPRATNDVDMVARYHRKAYFRYSTCPKGRILRRCRDNSRGN